MPKNKSQNKLPDYALEIEDLRKVYKGKGKSPDKEALKGISLKVKRGTMFALLGPNGAGKSTLINILAGLVNKTSGNAQIWGIDIDKDARNSRSAIGIVPQEINIDAFFTPRELLDLHAGLYGVPKDERRTNEILKLVELDDKADTYARRLSGGMKRRLLIAKAMVHNPPVLILDEPTAGVDVELRKQLWKNIKQLNKQGVTVLLTTHYLEEAEELCDTIAIINHGELIACEDKKTMLARFGQKEIIATLDKEIKSIPKVLQDMDIEIVGKDTIKIRYNTTKEKFDTILSRLCDSNLTIADLTTKQSDLEDIFLELTSKKRA